MIRQRSSPWIHRKSRFIIASIGTFGVVDTAYLTFTKFSGQLAACPTEGCDKVLESPYAIVFGLPLALFGLLGYLSMTGMAVAPWLVNPESNKKLRSDVENWTWFLMFAQSAAMVIFSAYLMYVMAFEIKAVCLYCIISALCALALFVLTIIGHDWDDVGKLFFTGVIVGMVTLIATLAIYAPIHSPQAKNDPFGVTTVSNPDNVALAQHLTDSGAKMYAAFWCGACKMQKELFGQEAVSKLPYIECDPKGENPQPDLCRAKQVKAYPTWEIQGKTYTGVRPLNELAELSGYSGSRNFGNP